MAMREDTVFGPIFSRRLGSSLGINLLPQKGKICNFDCIYCECGWNRDGRGDSRLPSVKEVEAALAAKLRARLGEPTLNPEFPQIIDVTIRLRNEWYPEAKISVLSNATRLFDDGVFEALRKVDNPILKLDAPTDEAVALINQPQGHYKVAEVVEGMRRFKGEFILQTMFLKGEGFDSSEPTQLKAWMDIVRELRPREIMVYTIDRETPAKGLVKFTEGQMRELVAPLTEEGFRIQIKG